MAFSSISWIGTDSCLIETKLIKYLNNYLQKSDTNSHTTIELEDYTMES